MKDPKDLSTVDISELTLEEFIDLNSTEITTKDKMYLVKGDKEE